MQGNMVIAIRSSSRAETLPESLRRTVAELDPELPVNEISTARQASEHLLANYSLIGKLLGGFALLGLLLSGLGIYGVIAGFVAERTNEVMKVLTVFTAVLLPLSLVAGIYGMNFAHMPELAWRLGYLWALGVMAVVGIGLWVYFARRGFVGGPRLSQAPRVVGKGLADLVRLTIKPVAGVAGLLGARPGRNERKAGEGHGGPPAQ
jgi:hypothetical protein